MSSIKTVSFGGNGGGAFNMQIIKRIGLHTGLHVDQISINGNAHGGIGGVDKGSIPLSDAEYINKVEMRADKYVNYVKFTTNMENSIEGGDDTKKKETLANIRVIAIGGNSGDYVDKLDIMYVADCVPYAI